MAEPSITYLLDTNVLLHLVRGNSTGQYIEATYGLRRQPQIPLISIVTHGEIWSFSAQNSWGKEKRSALETMLVDLVTVDLNLAESGEILDVYVAIDTHSRATGRKMSKNDLWIAASARVTRATLLACDHDFNHLHPDTIKRIYIDPTLKLPTSPGRQP